MSVTVYGTVVSIESTGPPEVDPVDPPAGEDVLALGRGGPCVTSCRRTIAPALAAPKAELREGEEEPKTWVHVHIKLDEPHAGELQVNAPESQVSGMLEVDGRARVTVASN